MELLMYQVDAFTNKVFGGNPAAVIELEEWLDDATLQNIAIENNLSETAYFVKEGEAYKLRWFTPGYEVKLCGHATLASAFVLFEILGYEGDVIRFESLSGPLYVTRKGDMFEMDFPANPGARIDDDGRISAGLGNAPMEVYESDTKYMAVYETEDQVRDLQPDFRALKELGKNIIATAPGTDSDFVSRFFAPAAGIDEDPVTGSAHTVLTPYWSARLGRNQVTARQISKRGGDLVCEMDADRVLIGGQAVLYLSGRIEL